MATKCILISAVCLTLLAPKAFAQTTQPSPGEPLKPVIPPPTMMQQTENAPRGIVWDAPSIPLIREDTHINKRTGRVTHSADGQQVIFTFDAEENGPVYPPMIVLPNLKLLMLEGAVTPATNDFPISGTVTEFKSRNFILLDNVPRGSVPDRKAVGLVREGTRITNRSGRLGHTANGQALFTFDTDGKTQQDAPMIIQQNLKLQTMENSVIALTKDAHFRVSGVVTEYKGKNYILLEKAVVIADVDQQM